MAFRLELNSAACFLPNIAVPHYALLKKLHFFFFNVLNNENFKWIDSEKVWVTSENEGEKRGSGFHPNHVLLSHPH